MGKAVMYTPRVKKTEKAEKVGSPYLVCKHVVFMF